jgi:vanillate O-demethylase ferredoxin subunit
VVVVGHERVAADVVVVTVRSAAASGASLPGWAPGDHLDVELARDLVRQYSLCGDPADDGIWSFAVRHQPEGTGGSIHVHEKLAVGDVLRVAGPKAMFGLEDAAEHLLVAGGIGVTPLLPMAEHLHAAGRPFRMVYVGRGADRMPFADRAAALGPSVRIVDRDLEPDFALADVVAGLSAESLVYACGPDAMLAALADLVPTERLRVESFRSAAELPGAAAGTEAGGDADPAGAAGSAGAFEVQLGPGGRVLPVPADTALLDVLLDAGVDVLWSCREGTCASCETPLLEGEADHRDQILTEEERAAQDCLFPCVSRARSSRLILDV